VSTARTGAAVGDAGISGAGAADGKRLLGEILVARQQLTPGQLSAALVQQRISGKRLGAMLVELGALDERVLAEALAEHFELPVVDLRRQAPEAAAVARLPEASARGFVAVPLRLDGDTLEVAVADPSHELALELHRATGLNIRLVVASTSDIRRAIDRNYRALAGVEQYVAAFESATVGRNRDAPRTPGNATTATDSAPVVQVVSLLIAQALRDRASDIHLEPMGDVVRVRYRIDGVLHDILTLPSSMGGAVVSRIKVLGGMNIVERRRPQDGQIATEVDGRAVDIRVSSTGTIAGEKIVMRLLDKTKTLFKLSELGMPRDTYQTYSALVRSPFGMVVCAGPTGSGKTTSLYATMTELNSPERNMMTIEDPVEYVFPSINQIQINDQAGISFANGLRSILRQDPDVILVGEIRDAETATIATQSALTGHFVLSSLHATDATAALLRLLDMGVEPFVVSSAVIAVLSQRLVRRICEQCKRPYDPTNEELAFYYADGAPRPEHGFFHGEGCAFCTETGYQDRIGVYELLRLTPEMKAFVAQKPTHDQVRTLAVEQGMRTLRQEALRLVTDGVTTIAEVVRSIYML
jgi:type IV pilus assembly protein PilB